jgi:hypothetical protein
MEACDVRVGDLLCGGRVVKVDQLTLTDEEIREQWAYGLDTGDQALVRDAQLALGTWRGATEHLADDQAATERREARQRICDAINVRAERGRKC